jgi:hypothetical protein
VAFLAIFVVISLFGRGDPLIDKPAADLNLSAAELGAGVSLIGDEGLSSDEAKTLRDSNLREFEAEGVYIRSVVLVGKTAASDAPGELIDEIESSMKGDASSVAVSFDKLQSVLIGDRGGIEPFTMKGNARSLQGYIVAFVQRNVVVLLIELGDEDQITKESVQQHARLIANRLQ